MEESLLLKFCIVLIIIIIPILFVSSIIIEPKQIPLSKLNKNFLDQKIKISGTIQSIKNLDNLQIINLTSNEKYITLINYNPINLSKNQKIIAIGKVQEYNKNLEINIERIYLISLKLS